MGVACLGRRKTRVRSRVGGMVYGLGEKVCQKQAEVSHDAWLTEKGPTKTCYWCVGVTSRLATVNGETSVAGRAGLIEA